MDWKEKIKSLLTIRKHIKSFRIMRKNHSSSVRIIDNGHTFSKIHSKSIIGNGVCVLNANAINGAETTKLRIDEGGVLSINGIVSIFSNANVHVGSKAIISIGDSTYFNEGLLLSAKHEIIIGERCAFSNNVTILDSDFHEVLNDNNRSNEERGIHIGNHVWIGAGTTILKNVIIGDNCIIGAGSIVTHDIPSNSMAVGLPAKVIKTGIDWK